MVAFWAAFCQSKILCIFTERSILKHVFVGILRFQKRFGVDILDFSIELSCRYGYFGLFGLATVLATFQK
jgi:hypothetical protein